jgi:hypothetical protein
MTTLSWLELLLFATVIVGALMYHFGHAIGKAQAEKNQLDAAIAKCMARHPAGKHQKEYRGAHLRAVEE